MEQEEKKSSRLMPTLILTAVLIVIAVLTAVFVNLYKKNQNGQLSEDGQAAFIISFLVTIVVLSVASIVCVFVAAKNQATTTSKVIKIINIAYLVIFSALCLASIVLSSAL